MQIDVKRSEYDNGILRRSNLKASPFEQFQIWFDEAIAEKVIEPNAMSLATAWADGRTLARTVLLKNYDAKGFVFFTNFDGRKGRQLKQNPQACLLFPWLALQRQVIISGKVEKVSEAESEAYFKSRPRGSQVGAWASAQSSVVPNRETLETRWAEIEQKYPEGHVPLPPWWGGFRVVPREIEFWQGRANRLHDRFIYTQTERGDWKIDRLAP